jgi:pilus assembly protein TadC
MDSNPFQHWGSWGELLKPLKLMISLQFRLALSALRRDARRLFQGITSYLTGLYFLIVFGLLVNVLLILGLVEFAGLTLFYSVLIAAGTNLLIAVVFFAVARSKLKHSFFSETKKIVEETLDDMR